MSCNIVINQEASLPVLDKVTPEAKSERSKTFSSSLQRSRKLHRELKDRFLKDNQLVQITLKDFTDYFQQDLNNLASILTALKKQHIL